MKKVLGSILLIFSIILISFSVLVYNLSFWEYLQEKHDVNESLAQPLNKHLVNYFKDANYKTGPEYQGLTEKEEQHMLDVKKRVNTVIFLALITSISAILFLSRLKKREIKQVLIWSSAITVIVPLLFFLFPFEPVFSVFHKLFFTQGTYLFSQADLLIRAYPEEFFQDFVIWMISISFGIAIALFITGLLLKKFK